MMIGLFSVFDPVVLGLSLNWMMIFILVFVIFMKYFSKESWISIIFNKLSMLFYNNLSGVGGLNYKGIVIWSFVLFMFIVMSNLSGLFPYSFTISAHPVMTLGLGVVLWVSFVILGWLFNYKNSVAHLVPLGSPLVLAPFLVLIELVSHVIRPITLSIRLAANMMAGHLIIGLLSYMLSIYASVIGLFFLLILEVGVCFIQALVFSILMLLYAIEYY